MSHPAAHSSTVQSTAGSTAEFSAGSDASLSGPARIIVVRHGATEWSTIGRHTGRTDLELTAEGEAQARAVAPLLASVVDQPEPLVFTSPLRRAAATAALALPQYEATVVDSLVEFDYGAYEGLTTPEIFDRDADWNLFRQGCPGGESASQVVARCDSFIAKLERMAVGRVVVAFTHGHLSRILSMRLLQLPTESAAALYNETASVGVMDARRDRFVLVGWNRQAM